MKYTTPTTNSRHFLLLMLGLLSAFGPFVMDMYLASFPEIAIYYSTEPAMVQLSLTACTIGLALGQLILGPISDALGRKRPLLLSLFLYTLASLVCMQSPTIGVFIAMRFLQGLAAAGGVVISRSIAADRYTGTELAKMYGIIGMINGVSTVLAPMFGGGVSASWGWQSVFLLLLVLGIVMLLGTCFLPESLPQPARTKLNLPALGQGMREVSTNPYFVAPTAQYALVIAMIFINLSSGPFLLKGYGLSTGEVSLVFGINALALAITAGIASRYRDMVRVTSLAKRGMFVSSLAVAATLLLGMDFWLYEVALFCLYLFIGALCTTTTTLAMGAERKYAGIASALFGTVGFIAGGIVSPLVGIGSIQVATSLLFVVVSAASLVLSSGKAVTPETADAHDAHE